MAIDESFSLFVIGEMYIKHFSRVLVMFKMCITLLKELNINQALTALFLISKMANQQYNMISLSIDTWPVILHK